MDSSVNAAAGGVGRTTGVVETLCNEIRYPFSAEMERLEILVSFTRALYFEVHDMFAWHEMIRRTALQQRTSPEVAKAFSEVRALLDNPYLETEKRSAALHNGILFQPDDGPCDRFIEMLSSIVSAIRFGLEHPHMSRHAAHAAQGIWAHKYGVRLFDECTSDWEKDWARRIMAKALSPSAQRTISDPVTTTPE